MQTIVGILFGSVLILNTLLMIFSPGQHQSRAMGVIGVMVGVTLFIWMFMGTPGSGDDCGPFCEVLAAQFEASPATPDIEEGGSLGAMSESLVSLASGAMFMEQSRFEFIISQYAPSVAE
jgi:hypothetical protein